MRSVTLRNKNFKIISIFLLFLILLISGCKSIQKDTTLQEMNPLALLDEKSSIYISVPVKKHIELTSNIICAEVPQIEYKDASKIVERINILYAGIGTIKDRSRIQIAGKGSFPSIGIKSIFTQKNGWNKTVFTAQQNEEAKVNNFPFMFNIYNTANNFQIAFPSEAIVTVGQNVEPLLNNYGNRIQLEDSEITDWISQPSDDVLFYITQPGQYLRNLIGATVTFKCNKIFGVMKYIPLKNSNEYSKKYSLSFTLELSDKRAMKAMISLLSLAMGMTDGKVNQIDDSQIQINDIEIKESQLIDLFTRDPITSKHFVPVKE